MPRFADATEVELGGDVKEVLMQATTTPVPTPTNTMIDEVVQNVSTEKVQMHTNKRKSTTPSQSPARRSPDRKKSKSSGRFDEYYTPQEGCTPIDCLFDGLARTDCSHEEWNAWVEQCEVEEKFLRPKGANIFRVNREMREKNTVYDHILDEF